jgi:hypothetical protein
MDFISTCIIIEELAKVDPGIATIVDVHVMFGLWMIQTEEMKFTLLFLLLYIYCVCVCVYVCM